MLLLNVSGVLDFSYLIGFGYKQFNFDKFTLRLWKNRHGGLTYFVQFMSECRTYQQTVRWMDGCFAILRPFQQCFSHIRTIGG